jgi:hypothetical protein
MPISAGLTPAENLIIKTMQDALEDGYNHGSALIRASHTLGLPRKRVLQAWIRFLSV